MDLPQAAFARICQQAAGQRDICIPSLRVIAYCLAIGSLVRDSNYASMNVAIRAGMFARGRCTKHHKGEDMPHCIFSARKSDA
jgi:hypothetical protein